MHARVVRFTGVTPQRISEISERVEASDGPPEGVESTGFQVLVDKDQGTAIFIGFFENEEKLRAASPVFEAMDPSETPGERASVDLCEVKVDASP